jgi:hypothetical protein
MQALTPEGRRIVEAVAERHGVSIDAVTVLLHALVAGGGTAAQFNHPDLGGMGQWSQGGMIMVGDMFNHGLKARVDALCNELADLVRGQTVLAPTAARQSQSQSQWHGVPNVQAQGFGGAAGVSLFVPGSDLGVWWPAALGNPASTGAQNDLRYAWFSGTRRLAIRRNGHVTVYDTGDHRISGFSQQQSGDQSLTFTSQHGVVRVADLPEVGVAAETTPVPDPAPMNQPASHPAAGGPFAAAQPSPAPAPSPDDVFGKIEKLAELRQKGILTDEEFAAKKTELLSRL